MHTAMLLCSVQHCGTERTFIKMKSRHKTEHIRWTNARYATRIKETASCEVLQSKQFSTHSSKHFHSQNGQFVTRQ